MLSLYGIYLIKRTRPAFSKKKNRKSTYRPRKLRIDKANGSVCISISSIGSFLIVTTSGGNCEIFKEAVVLELIVESTVVRVEEETLLSLFDNT